MERRTKINLMKSNIWIIERHIIEVLLEFTYSIGTMNIEIKSKCITPEGYPYIVKEAQRVIFDKQVTLTVLLF